MPPGPLQPFAQGLRDLRMEAGNPSYRAMERRAGYSASALSAAAAGDRLPSLAVTQAYVGACGGDQEEWARIWYQIRADQDRAHDIRIPPAVSRRPLIRVWITLAALGLTGVVAGTTLRQEPETATPPQPPFTAVAGPGCPRDASRSVRIGSAPGQDGWKDARAPGWTGAGCSDSFLFSQLAYDSAAAKHPENSVQWRFTSDLRGQQQCTVEIYVPNSDKAGRRVWYTVGDDFLGDTRTVGEFTLDQSMRRGTWVQSPAAVTITSGLVVVEIKDTGKGNAGDGQSMAAGPARLTCTAGGPR